MDNRNTKLLIFLSLLIILVTGLSFTPRSAIYKGENVAVVELFTSEGCSSCPAADEMLKEMTDIMAKENKPVVGLAYHITYWDHLGWKDPYSQEKFTDRQKKYCGLLQVPSIYTPQMVVDGEFEFVGSDPISFRRRVEEVLTTSAPYQLDARATIQDNEISVAYSLNKKPKHEVMNIALIEIFVKNSVQRGENKNKTLQHYNVVRKLETADLLPTGEFKMTMPADLDPSNCAVVLFIQHQRNLSVLGAQKISLSR